jgi:hypothetical protein
LEILRRGTNRDLAGAVDPACAYDATVPTYLSSKRKKEASHLNVIKKLISILSLHFRHQLNNTFSEKKMELYCGL